MSIRRPSPEAPRAVAPQPTSVPHRRLDLVLRAGVGAGAGAPPSQEATAAEMDRLHELVFLHGHDHRTWRAGVTVYSRKTIERSTAPPVSACGRSGGRRRPTNVNSAKPAGSNRRPGLETHSTSQS